ncbi:MAG: DUF559 domain-containing protein [Jatrophihabitantaceae bacterium]
MPWTTVARRQAGLIARRQLLTGGVPPSTVDHWLNVGRLESTPTNGVYRVAGSAISPESRVWLAALSTRAPVSYLSAARWWGMPVPDDGIEHVTRLARRRLVAPPGVRIHRVGLLRPAIVHHRGLWVTSPPETVLDCLGWLTLGRARGLADRAIQQGWLTMADVMHRLDGQRGRWGNRQIRRLAADLDDGADAESERRLQRLLRRARITGWVTHLPFLAAGRRFEIDLAFPALRLAIEVDGYAYHNADPRFQADRTKQNALIAAGWRVLRFTWADIEDRPDYVLGQVLTLLAA